MPARNRLASPINCSRVIRSRSSSMRPPRPIAAPSAGQPTPVERSFDDLIGEQLQRWRYRQPEGPGGPQVDHELVLRGLLDGEIRRPRPLQDLIHVRSGAPVQLVKV